MSRISTIFADLRAAGRRALMPFITAGYPSLEATEQAILCMEQAGASIVEVGFPFSDPIADGPVITASMHAALQAGVTPPRIFEAVRRVRPRTQLGLVAMVSESIVMRMGPERFVSEAAAAGFDGLIVPDIDLNAAQPLGELTRSHGLTLSLLIAPTTPTQRIAQIASLCSGFVYLLARTGVTGESDQLDVNSLAQRVALVRSHTDLPIAVGLGISQPEQVRVVAGLADAVIVGSAVVRRMAGPGDAAAAAGAFVRSLAEALNPIVPSG